MNLFQEVVPVYACKHCGHVTCDPIEDGYGERYCPVDDCDGSLSEPTYRDARYITVAAYEVDRVYGGPEEGGWYYGAGTLIAGTQRSFLPEDAPQAMIYRETLRMRYMPEGFKRRWDAPVYNVCSWAEREAPKAYPLVTPRYC